MVFYSGTDKTGEAEVALDPGGAWTPITAPALVPNGADRIVLKLVAVDGSGPVQFDDITLQRSWQGGFWWIPTYQVDIFNPSAEGAQVGVRSPFDRLVPGEIRSMLGVLLNPLPYKMPALWQFYADFQFKSFDGYFGWLAVPLPDWLYSFIGWVALVAFAGLVVRVLVSTWRRLSAALSQQSSADTVAIEWLGFVCLVSLAVAIVVGFARQQLLLSYYGLPSFPQGRYLFVLIIPAAWLLLAGLWQIWKLSVGLIQLPLRWTKRDRQRPERGAGYGVQWASGIWMLALTSFQLYCLFGLILPYFAPR
jgi:hypothetical protein